ncbi:MAG TPA: FtsQ-type POTRA domain-containing protein [Firmicutes bacterium]|nr:FtsQ-type POTRA domain-containing protein [Bacillota bacterium]
MQRRIISIIIIIIVLATYAFLNSGYFALGELEWVGLTFLSPSDLFEQTQLPQGNVFRIDKQALEEEITAHVWVKTAHVTWSWPNHLTVQVTERQPIALVINNDSWFLLDREGVLLPPPRGFSYGSLPLVTNADVEASEHLISVARLLSRLPAGLYENVSEWNSKEQTLITRSGTQILLGSLRELDRKVATLELVLEELAKQKVIPKKIDLRITNSPVIIE